VPYRLLWVLSGFGVSDSFALPYGYVLRIPAAD
jgi:hypothetical protein